MECKNVVCILTFSWVFIFSNWISSSSKLLNFSSSWFEWIVNFFVLNKFYTCMRGWTIQLELRLNQFPSPQYSVQWAMIEWKENFSIVNFLGQINLTVAYCMVKIWKVIVRIIWWEQSLLLFPIISIRLICSHRKMRNKLFIKLWLL